jgi:hypothetical protein
LVKPSDHPPGFAVFAESCPHNLYLKDNGWRLAEFIASMVAATSSTGNTADV